MKTDWRDRFWRHVEKTDTCWLWTASKQKDGYGQFVAFFNKPQLVHRLAYFLCKGGFDDEMTIDHLCYVRNCVNPDHLEVVTRAENTRRANERRRNNKTE